MNVNPFSYLIEKLKSKVSKSGDTMTGVLNIAGQDLNLRTSDSNSDDSGDIAFFYGTGQEKSRIWTDGEYLNGVGPNYRIYKKDGTELYTGRLATVGELPNITPASYSVTFSTYISDTSYIKVWKMGKMYFISFNAPINPCGADTVLISGFPNTIQRFYGLLGSDSNKNVRIELKNGELVTNTTISSWEWFAGNIFFYES